MADRVWRWHRVAALAGGLVAVMSTLALAAVPVGAASYVPVSGEGSSWSANAINQWIADVQPDGMRVNYTANGSTTGRQDYIKGLTDFAASDIPFQTNPTDGSAPEAPQPGSYAYMPITAGGTVFMYNLKINGQQVTDPGQAMQMMSALRGANTITIQVLRDGHPTTLTYQIQ